MIKYIVRPKASVAMAKRMIARFLKDSKSGKTRLEKVSIVAISSSDSSDGRRGIKIAVRRATNAIECHGGTPLARGKQSSFFDVDPDSVIETKKKKPKKLEREREREISLFGVTDRVVDAQI
jgi:hypothetical protein